MLDILTLFRIYINSPLCELSRLLEWIAWYVFFTFNRLTFIVYDEFLISIIEVTIFCALL